MTPQRQKRLREQIRRSRARLMVSDPALAMVLMYLRFVATKDVYRISTNGREILFDPGWFQKLGKKETDYILSHEVIHIVLEDTKRPAFFTGDRFHHACDIIACSVMRNRGWQDDELPHIGKLPHRTYFPGHEGNELMPLEAYREVPFDPSGMKAGERRRFQIDSDDYWGRHNTPQDGTLILFPSYDDALEIPNYEEPGKVRVKYQQFQQGVTVVEAGGVDEESEAPVPTAEDSDDSYEEELDVAIDRLLNLIEEMESLSPQQAELLEWIWKGVGSARLEWKKILDEFLQEEVNDYSFLPPDRRFADSGFFLPDFNQTERSLKDVLFMVDSSGSVNDDIIADIYGEICAAIEQYDGTLQGKLGFFDTQVTTPVPFGSIQQLLKIRPKGNGGTDFSCIFRYLNRFFDKDPSCIVIITDGLGEYPAEEASRGVPVLWILYGDVPFPNWGKQAGIQRSTR